jgi:cobalt-zinc-cadmium efflux system outer membrane protein
MKRTLILFAALSLSSMSLQVWGQPVDSNGPVSLQDYLKLAALNNAELKAEFENWKAAVEQIPQAEALPDPEIEYGKFVRQSDMQMNQMVGIMQMFPWFGKIAAMTDVASSQAKAAMQKFEATKLKLFWQVKESFYEFAYLATAIDIAKDNLELLKHFEEVARTKYAAATAGHPDVIRAQVELAELEDVLKTLEKFREPMVAKLNALLNRPTDAALVWPKREPPGQTQIDRQKVIDMIIKLNPELTKLDWEIEAAKYNVELAKKRFYPDIGVGVEWTQFDKSGGNSGRDSVALMFRMNLPLWQNSYKAGERQAKANAEQAQQTRINEENKILAQNAQVLYEIDDAQRKIVLYGDVLVAKTQELVQASESAYSAGTLDFLSLIDAQRMLLKYQLDYERAVTNKQQKIAELEMLIAVELK